MNMVLDTLMILRLFSYQIIHATSSKGDTWSIIRKLDAFILSQITVYMRPEAHVCVWQWSISHKGAATK